MTLAVTYRVSPHARLDFLCLDVAKDIVSEFLWATEKLLLGAGQRNGGAKLKFHQMQGADEISKLEQSVASRFHVLGEFDLTTNCLFKYLVKHPSDWCLSAVIVYLDMLNRSEEIAIRKNEVFKGGFEAFDNLIRGVDEFLVHVEAMIPVFDFAGKSHHARKDAASQLAAQHGIVLLAANERPCVKAMSFKTYFAVRAFKKGNVFGYVNGLIMEHHPDNVETGFSIGNAEVSRFVHEYAQRLCVHFVQYQKREWRDMNPATHAESFPRIPVTPSQGKKSPRIIANRRCGCNGVRAEFFNGGFFRRAA